MTRAEPAPAITDDDVAEVRTVDLGDPRLFAGDRPERIWRTMRRAGVPLHMTGGRDHWAVTRYDQIRDVFQHASALSSENGMRLGEKTTDQEAGSAAGGTSILVSDDPLHGQMRHVLEPLFSPRAVRRLTERTSSLAHRLVRQAVEQPAVDFVDAVVGPLLTDVACDIVGVPDPDRAEVAQLCRTAFSGAGYATAKDQIGAHVELLAYCADLLAMKRRSPGDDAASALAHARIDGAPMPLDAAIMNCHDLVLGGNASARNALSSVPVTLVEHPDFWAGLRADPTSVGAGAHELLRYESPVNHVLRTLVDDLEIEGVHMRRGELVTLWLRSGNRDETAFAQADRLRTDLPRRAHLSFGVGAHRCLAVHVARLETESLVRALVDLVDQATLTGTPVRLESNFLRGYRSVRIALTPRRPSARAVGV